MGIKLFHLVCSFIIWCFHFKTVFW